MSIEPMSADATPSADATQEITAAGRTGEPTWASDVEEVARLRAEVADLNSRLDTRHRRASAIGTMRRITAAVLIAITAFAMVASVVGVWSARTAFNTDKWVATIAPLPQDPKVAAAVADYATNQVFAAIDVQQRVQTVLPAQAAFIAGPVTSQLRDAVEKTVYNVLQSDQFQRIWLELNRRAHDRAVAILNGTSDIVVAHNDRVEIDLLPLINQVLRALSTQLPTLFGKQLTLPDLSSGAIPENLRVRVEDALGVTLPANFAQFTVYNSGQLAAVQQMVKTAKRDLVLFVVATFVLLGLALLISPGRRRTLLQLGLWLVVAAVTVAAVIRAVRDQILNQVPAGLYRDGAAAAVTTVFSQLRTRGDQIIWIGAVLAAVMYLIGPGRGPTWLRRRIAAGARAVGRWTRTGTRAAVTNGPGFTARYLDVLRVGGLVVAAVLALILSSWTSLLVIVVALAAYEVLVTLVGRSAAAHDTEAPPGVAAGGPA
ncbi:hypothetical protein [Krasilnikovia sp. MM14-A1004]|uniref:hypothetical protein n=1 Tax=Krasilnikovia sp. MM14-A1004 TaxID=3373541 RepID=UPI00399D4B4E